MQHLKALKVFSLILGFVLVTFGCVISENTTGFQVTADGTSEGILLNFSNIPEDTVLLWVTFMDNTSDDKTGPQKYNINNYNIYFQENELSDLKESGHIIWPFVRTGHEYTISVYSRTNMNGMSRIEYSTNAIPSGGIYLLNNPSLRFTNENNSLTLSEMPLFSNGVSYTYPQEGIFSYCVSIHTDDNNGYQGGDVWSNELTVNSVSTMINKVKEDFREHVEFKGELPVSAYVHCYLNYGNLRWIFSIPVAQKITVSF